MKIIRETIRKVGKIDDYRGICDGCGTPVECDEELIVIEVADLEDRVILCPADRLVCPHCSRELVTINIYKNMDVSGELARLAQGE